MNDSDHKNDEKRKVYEKFIKSENGSPVGSQLTYKFKFPKLQNLNEKKEKNG